MSFAAGVSPSTVRPYPVVAGIDNYRKGASDLDKRTSGTRRRGATRPQDALLKQRQAASLIGVSERTLECWRSRGGGPPFVKISRRAVRYRRKDIDQWVAERVQYSTSEELRPARRV